jgi:hypothetical protein
MGPKSSLKGSAICREICFELFFLKKLLLKFNMPKYKLYNARYSARYNARY